MRLPKSTTPISRAATDLIVLSEVTNESYYNTHYQHPTWPGLSSGVTVGIGYDLGQVAAAEFEDDWGAYLDAARLDALKAVVGLSGTAAKAAIARVSAVPVSWGDAVAEFTEQSQPRTIAETEAALPNTGELSPDSLGALVSLVYNRGACFVKTGPRYAEMQAIKALMGTKQYDLIPDQIRGMKRLWPAVPGLQARREAEADLFQAGLGV